MIHRRDLRKTLLAKDAQSTDDARLHIPNISYELPEMSTEESPFHEEQPNDAHGLS
jgi:hypothetical protein